MSPRDLKTRNEEIIYLIDSIDIGILILDKDCIIRAINKAFCSLFNLVREDYTGLECGRLFASLFGSTWREIMSVSCNEGGPCTFRDALLNKQPYEKEIHVALKDDFPHTLNVKGAFYRPSSHGPQYLVLLWHEITDQKIIENRFSSLFSDSKDMIFTALSDGTIENINEAGVKLLGFSRKSEVIGNNLEDFFVNNEDKKYHRRILSEHGFVKDFEVVLRCKTGENIVVLETSTATRENNGKMIEYSGIIKDISDRLKTEQSLMKMSLELAKTHEKLQNTQTQLIQREKLASLGEMAAGIAHEINNPLGFIKSNFASLKKYHGLIAGYLEIVERLVPALRDTSDESLRHTIQKLERIREKNNIDYIKNDIDSLFLETEEGFKRIVNINENLMSFARSEGSNKIEDISLNSAIEETLVVAKNEIKYYADIKKELSPLPSIEGNLNQIKQVILNILVNSAQAIRSQKRDDRGLITITTYSGKGSVYCRICDDGPGMPPKVIEKIFDPFFTQKEVGKGTGLGLSISYDIVVKKHGGTLTVQSEEGKSTCFTIKLPVHPPH